MMLQKASRARSHLRIYERDIDLVLAEEFYANPDFATWVLEQAGSFTDASATVSNVHVSLSDDSGESDVTVIYDEGSGGKFALLIENKIDAPFQPDQLKRYKKRGEAGIIEGWWNKFLVLLCAPKSYIEKNLIAREFDAAISYEAMGAHVRQTLGGARGDYRAKLLIDAAPRGASAYIKKRDEITDQFWLAAYQLASLEFPVLEAKQPDYARGTSWVMFKPKHFSQRINLDLKGRQGYADLTFQGVPFDKLEPLARPFLESGMFVRKTGKSSAISFKINSFSVEDGVSVIETKVRSGFEACKRLLLFYGLHRAALDEILERADLQSPTPPIPPSPPATS